MNKQREAMQFALETLEDIFGKHKIDVTAINMLREALAEPDQEPTTDGELYAAFLMGLHSKNPTRKPLTDEQLRTLARDAGIKLMNDEALALGYLPAAIKKFAKAIERAHGITND